MSLFSSLYVGTSGLQTGQEALNVVAHNVTNADTIGYVRQQVSQSTREYTTLDKNITGVSWKQTGLGVYISEVRQVRDRFLDAAYREEIGRKGFYDVSYGAVEEVETILGELHDATFSNSLKNLWTSIEEMAKDPSSEVCQSMFVQYSQNFIEAAKNAYKDLSDYQDKLNFSVTQKVDRINDIGHKIFKLNNQIRSIEAGGIEHANDLKDQRNQLLDELSELANISYSDDIYGNVIVKLEGHDFVQPNVVNDMGYDRNRETGFYTCFWTDTAKSEVMPDGTRIYDASTAPVFDLTTEISSLKDTDIGSLKSTVLARGDHRGNFMDISTEEAYEKVEDSVLLNVMGEFDKLVHSVVTVINDAFKNAADPATGYLCDANGNPIQIFERIDCEEYTMDPGTGTWSATPENPRDSATWFTIENIMVNEDLLQYPAHLDMIRADDSVDYDTMTGLMEQFEKKQFVLNPTLTNEISISEYYSCFVAQIANSGNVYMSLKDNQDLTVESVEASRQGSMGVSTDEELSNMIKFQNAYNASSRFINVIDECMEHIISTLGT